MLYPGGFRVPVLNIILAPGVMEDFLLFLFNHHTVLSCVAVTKAVSFNRSKRRMAFVLQNSFTFFLATFNVSLAFFGFPRALTSFINLVGLAPLCLMLNTVTVSLLKSKRFKYDGSRNISHKIREAVGVVVVLCAILVIAGMLVLASMFTASSSHAGVLAVYFFEVQLYSFCLNFVSISLGFVGSSYLELSLFSNPYEDKTTSSLAVHSDGFSLSHNTFTTGRYFMERNMATGLKLVHGRSTVCSEKQYFRRISFIFFQFRPYCRLFNFNFNSNELSNSRSSSSSSTNSDRPMEDKSIEMTAVTSSPLHAQAGPDRTVQKAADEAPHSSGEIEEQPDVFGFCLLKFSYTSKVVNAQWSGHFDDA